MTLAQAIKAQARRLGFDLAGITTPEPPPHQPVYLDWLRAGRHAEMAYLAAERAVQRRADLLRILPECRSILVLGIRYPAPYLPDPSAGSETTPSTAPRPAGQVAAYAWGADYHLALPERLQALVAFIEGRLGYPVPNRWYTDTGPILERDLAQRAGLGWIGKNTCLINPQSGSYYLLAEILLGVALEADTPFVADRCGTCTRCLQACPTGCILPDRTLDARRCISYLTIELKGTIPLKLRSQMGSWVFGCDVCQQVCPWNRRFAESQGDPAFSARPEVPHPDLIADLSLSPQAFNARFKGSPFKRTKRRGYLRNVTVALGNSGDERAIPALAQALQTDPEPLVRGHAAWALGKIGGQAAQEVLQSAAAIESDTQVQAEIRAALSALH